MAIRNFTEWIKLKYKYGRILNRNWRIRSTDQSNNIVSTTMWKTKNEYGPPIKLNSGAKPKNFSRGRTRTLNLTPLFFLFKKSKKLLVQKLKLERNTSSLPLLVSQQEVCGYYQSKKMKVITLRLVGKMEEITKPGNLCFKFDHVWVEKFVWHKVQTRGAKIKQLLWICSYSSDIARSTDGAADSSNLTTREQALVTKEDARKQVFSESEENDIVRSTSNSPILDLKVYDMLKETLHDFNVDHVIVKPKSKNTEAEEKQQRNRSCSYGPSQDFYYIKLDLKLLQFKIRNRNNQK